MLDEHAQGENISEGVAADAMQIWLFERAIHMACLMFNLPSI